ncbi:MAG: glycogen/starch synthase, partial [Bacteroidota bacterium]
FFCKGVIETVKKFGWPPDIIHTHGWMTSLIPFYLRTTYQNEPLFQKAKVVYSLYETAHETQLGEQFVKKASINNLSSDDLDAFFEDGKLAVHKGAISYADAIVKGTEDISPTYSALLSAADKPILDIQGDEITAAIAEFYDSLLAEEVEQ